MDAWIIILITVSSGILLLGLILALKNIKRKRQQNPNVLLSSPTFIPSTNSAPAFNFGQPPMMYQTTTPAVGTVFMPNTAHIQQTHPQPYMAQQPQPYTMPMPYQSYPANAQNNPNNPNITQGRQLHPDSQRGAHADDKINARPFSSQFM